MSDIPPAVEEVYTQNLRTPPIGHGSYVINHVEL